MKYLALVLCLLSQTAAAFDTQQLGQTLTQSPYLQARFTQEKSIAAMSRPLKTEGQLMLARDAGVLWQIEKPYTIAYFLSAEQLIEFADGQKTVQDAAKLPWLKQISTVMNALLAGDTVRLATLFELRLSGSAAHWQLSLVPKKPELAHVITRIELQGAAQIEAMQLIEASGDKTAIRFSAITTPIAQPAALNGLVSTKP